MIAVLRSDRADPWLAAGAAALLGMGAVGMLRGVATGDPVVAGLSAAVSGTGLAALLAAGWLEPVLLMALVLPLPALLATETARLSPIVPVSALAVAAWLAGPAAGTRGEAPPWHRAQGMAALFAATVVAAPFAAAPLAAAREVVNFGLLLGVLVVTLDRVARDPSLARRLSATLAAVAAAAGCAAILEAVGILPGRFPLAGSGLVRAAGGFGWPNELGMFLAVSFPFAFHEARSARGWLRIPAAAAVALTLLGLLATFSRGSWLAVLAAPVALVAVGEGRRAVAFWVASGLVALGADLATGGAVVQRLSGTTGDVLVAQRFLLMAAGLLMFQAHPWVGVGPGGFGDALDTYGVRVSGLFDFVGSAHNGYVHVAAEMGVVGLAALLWFVAGTLWTLGRGLRAEAPAHRSASPDSAPPPGAVRRSLRLTYLWAFATACLVTLFEWPFAHGIAELIALVAGGGMALVPRRSDP